VEQNITEATILNEEKIKGLSFKGIFQVFTAPTAFFEKLKNNPKVLIPYIVVILFTFIFMYTTADYIVKMQVESEQFQKQLQGQPVTPQIMKMIKINVMVMGTLVFALYPLVAAALALFVGNFIMGSKAGFKQILSVVLYGAVVYTVGMLILIPLIIAKGSIMVSLSLGVLAASQGPESILYTTLSKIGLFNIWEIIVAGIGFSVIYGMTRNKGYLLAVCSIGLLSVIQIIITAISQMIF